MLGLYWGQVRRICRQKPDKQPALLPDVTSVFDGFRMNRRIVQNHDRQAAHRQRKRVQTLTDPGCRDPALGAVCLALVLPRQQGKAVNAAAPLARHGDLLIGKLPAVRDAGQQRHTALVAVQQINVSLLRQGFKLGQGFALEGRDIGIGRVLYAPSYSLVAATVFFRNRFNASIPNCLPSSCSSSALASERR
jgi:hypothetical protein